MSRTGSQIDDPAKNKHSSNDLLRDLVHTVQEVLDKGTRQQTQLLSFKRLHLNSLQH